MRSLTLLIACAATLSACSRPDAPAADPAPSGAAAEPAAAGGERADARTAAFIKTIKQDFASQFVASASDACGSVKGKEPPDLKSGSPMQYGASGVIDWGRGKLDYVEEPGAQLTLVNQRGEGTFAFGVDIYELASGKRKYVAALSQLRNGALSATVTDEREAMDKEGDSDFTHGNLCVGGTTPPARITQGGWPLAEKHLQVPKTDMLCIDPTGKSAPVTLAFAFDGKTLQAGDQRFTAADAAYSEQLVIDPGGSQPGVIYSVNRADGAGAGLGLAAPRLLKYAQLDRPGQMRMMCSPA